MTDREKIKAEEQKISIYYEQNCACYTCGKQLRYHEAEAAHVIPKTRLYLKRYGKEIIHHRKNIHITCPGTCNSAVLMDPKTHPVEAAAHIEDIREALRAASKPQDNTASLSAEINYDIGEM